MAYTTIAIVLMVPAMVKIVPVANGTIIYHNFTIDKPAPECKETTPTQMWCPRVPQLIITTEE